MNIFVVSLRNPKIACRDLTVQLSRIYYERSETVPVIVVADCYNLTELPVDNLPTDFTLFNLEDFRRVSVVNGVDSDQIAQQMDLIKTQWTVVDFGQHDQATCTDFIAKLARYCYVSPRLREHSLVFAVPAVYLSIYARALNEAFNNLSENCGADASLDPIHSLFLSVQIERTLLSLPVLAGILRRVYRSLMRIYRRFRKVT